MYTINIDQKNNLESLYYNLYIIKHKELDELEKAQIDKNIKFLFSILDDINVSYQIQNTIIALAENKKNIEKYFTDLLKENNIMVK